MQIQISWLLQKPTDLDLHCLQRQGVSGFSRTRVNSELFFHVVVYNCKLLNTWGTRRLHLTCLFADMYKASLTKPNPCPLYTRQKGTSNLWQVYWKFFQPEYGLNPLNLLYSNSLGSTSSRKDMLYELSLLWQPTLTVILYDSSFLHIGLNRQMLAIVQEYILKTRAQLFKTNDAVS